MRFISLAENCHIVNALAPVDINGGKNSDVISVKDASRIQFIVQLGVTHAATTITVEECDDTTPNDSTAIAFNVYKEETADGDTLGSRTAVTDAGFATSANNGIFYVIDVDPVALTDGYPYVRVCLSDPGGATYGSILAVLSGLRYENDPTATAIT